MPLIIRSVVDTDTTQAQADLKRLEQQGRKTQTAITGNTSKVGKATKATAKLGKATSNLSSTLGSVGTSATVGASALTTFGGASQSATAQTIGLAGSFTPLLVAAAPVAAAIGALVAVYAAYTFATNKIVEDNKKLRESFEKLNAPLLKQQKTLLGLRNELGALTAGLSIGDFLDLQKLERFNTQLTGLRNNLKRAQGLEAKFNAARAKERAKPGGGDPLILSRQILDFDADEKIAKKVRKDFAATERNIISQRDNRQRIINTKARIRKSKADKAAEKELADFRKKFDEDLADESLRRSINFANDEFGRRRALARLEQREALAANKELEAAGRISTEQRIAADQEVNAAFRDARFDILDDEIAGRDALKQQIIQDGIDLDKAIEARIKKEADAVEKARKKQFTADRASALKLAAIGDRIIAAREEEIRRALERDVQIIETLLGGGPGQLFGGVETLRRDRMEIERAIDTLERLIQKSEDFSRIRAERIKAGTITGEQIGISGVDETDLKARAVLAADTIEDLEKQLSDKGQIKVLLFPDLDAGELQVLQEFVDNLSGSLEQGIGDAVFAAFQGETDAIKDIFHRMFLDIAEDATKSLLDAIANIFLGEEGGGLRGLISAGVTAGASALLGGGGDTSGATDPAASSGVDPGKISITNINVVEDEAKFVVAAVNKRPGEIVNVIDSKRRAFRSRARVS